MIMKYKKIKLEDNKSVLVDESAKGKTGYCFNISLSKIDKLSRDYEIGTFEEMYTYKIIATINHSISLDVPMIIMEDEVEKLAEIYAWNCKNEFFTTKVKANECVLTSKRDFIAGCKAIQQKNGYSESTLRKAFNQGAITYKEGLNATEEGNKFIQSLKQEYIELEMVENYDNNISIYPNVLQIKRNRVDGQLMAYVKK